MQDIEIPVPQWPEVCETFTRRHRGSLVTMRQLQTHELRFEATASHGTGELFTSMSPLQEVREGRNDDFLEIMVTVGEGLGETSFLIEHAVALYVRRIGNTQLGLRVDAGNGMTSLIELGIAADREC